MELISKCVKFRFTRMEIGNLQTEMSIYDPSDGSVFNSSRIINRIFFFSDEIYIVEKRNQGLFDTRWHKLLRIGINPKVVTIT